MPCGRTSWSTQRSARRPSASRLRRDRVSVVLAGIDVGTTAVKGIAIDDSGSVLARAQAGYPLSTPRRGWAEQDPEDWWQATEAVLEQLAGAAGAPAGIGLSGQMHGLVAPGSGRRAVA